MLLILKSIGKIGGHIFERYGTMIAVFGFSVMMSGLVEVLQVRGRLGKDKVIKAKLIDYFIVVFIIVMVMLVTLFGLK